MPAVHTLAMREVRTIKELVDAIGECANPPRIVSIDGALGAGKTTLGAELAGRLGARHLDLDSFLEPDQGCVINALRVDSLRKAVIPSGLVVLSGVCMLLALQKIGASDSYNVYLKRMNSRGEWADESELYGNETEEIAAAGVPTPAFT